MLLLVHFLIIIPVIKWCSLIGLHKSAVVLFDRGYPSFWRVNSAIPIDVVGMKSYMDSLFDLTCVPVGVTINKLNLDPNRNMPRFVLACSGIAEVWVRANRMSLSCFFILFHIDLPVSLIFLFYSCLFVCWWTLCRIRMGSCKRHLLLLTF